MRTILHKNETRGRADHGWLKSRHTFSFADYHEPARMGFGALRVINDDWIEGGAGFGMHPHRDMEIISVPLEGALRHRDSEGNQAVIRQGEVQIMSAGTGVAHSERNDSESDRVNLLQIWVLPKKLGIQPRYAQKSFAIDERRDRFQTIVSPDGRDGSVEINQDAFFSLADLSAGAELAYRRELGGNGLYLFVLKGSVEANGQRLGERDAAGFVEAETLALKAPIDAEILLIEVPMAPAL